MSSKSFKIAEIKSEYDTAVIILNGNQQVNFSDATEASRIGINLENLARVASIILLVNEKEDGRYLSGKQKLVVQETIDRCYQLFRILQQRGIEAFADNSQFPFIHSQHTLEVHRASAGAYTYSLENVINLSGVQLEEEEEDLIAMANTPIPEECNQADGHTSSNPTSIT